MKRAPFYQPEDRPPSEVKRHDLAWLARLGCPYMLMLAVVIFMLVAMLGMFMS